MVHLDCDENGTILREARQQNASCQSGSVPALREVLSGAKVESPNSSLSLLSWDVGSIVRHSKEFFELLIKESHMSSFCRRPAPRLTSPGRRSVAIGKWSVLCSEMPGVSWPALRGTG